MNPQIPHQIYVSMSCISSSRLQQHRVTAFLHMIMMFLRVIVDAIGSPSVPPRGRDGRSSREITPPTAPTMPANTKKLPKLAAGTPIPAQPAIPAPPSLPKGYTVPAVKMMVPEEHTPETSGFEFHKTWFKTKCE
jgi:hypothetical protein